MRLRLLWHAPTVEIRGIDETHGVEVSSRVRIGRASSDVHVVPLTDAAHLGGRTSYIIERRAEVWRIQHTGHIGSALVASRLVTNGASAELNPDDVIELRNPDGEPVVRLAWEG